jgi:hypothetical protein
MGLNDPNEVPAQAREVLLHRANQLFMTFSIQPRESFLHGQFDAALRRIERIRTVLETEEAAKPLEEAELKKQLSAWRARLKEAYVSLLVRQEASGQAKVDALWNEDEYLLNVLNVESEMPLQNFQKKTLSLIFLNACREPLSQQAAYLGASCWHERAAHSSANQEVLAAAGKDNAVVKAKAADQWRNARGSWNKLLDRHQFSPQSLPRRLAEISQRWNLKDFDGAVNLWEQLHLDMHSSFEARLRLGEAQLQVQQAAPALQDLLSDLDAFEKSDLPKHLQMIQDKAKKSPLAFRLELLARDWAPQGNIHWLRQQTLACLHRDK